MFKLVQFNLDLIVKNYNQALSTRKQMTFKWNSVLLLEMNKNMKKMVDAISHIRPLNENVYKVFSE